MEARERARFQKLLEERRAALVAEGDVEFEPESTDDTARKVDEDAAPLAEMNQVIASNRNRERVERLHQIDTALERLQTAGDDFGNCESCEEPIGLRRLELMPWTRLCIDCQSEDEKDDGPKTRKHITDYR